MTMTICWIYRRESYSVGGTGKEGNDIGVNDFQAILNGVDLLYICKFWPSRPSLLFLFPCLCSESGVELDIEFS